jgi:hypothetical protein
MAANAEASYPYRQASEIKMIQKEHKGAMKLFSQGGGDLKLTRHLGWDSQIAVCLWSVVRCLVGGHVTNSLY